MNNAPETTRRNAGGSAAQVHSLLRGLHQGSAKALLLVVLGEFVWPQRQPVWSATLLAALAELGIEPNAARKALSRTAESGLISPERSGRRVRWALAERGNRIMQSGYVRTYGWGTRENDWDGRWLLLSVTIPEARRATRQRLHARLGWAGLGSPLPGQWLTPHWERGAEIVEIVTGLGLEEHAHAVIGPIGPIGNEHRLVSAAWDLDELRSRYDQFIATYSSAEPAGDRACFQARIALVQDWRYFPYSDPDLPPLFLPRGWPGDEAARIFHVRHREWESASQRYWTRIIESV
ncbi:PaaX family transcriptional regulator C-terminal domain-containing protein [Nocardia sp. NPDC049526]|uniref:PaaX family transcriptional regulator n=1 Tax=Nocardia sp. NPDC049526 TaxID=3364316 RepID=UPI0037997F95